MDVKKTPVDFFAQLPHYPGKKKKICAFVAQELAESAKQNCDLSLTEKDFDQYKDKKATKKLAL